jgi:alkylation response protein AidB-like acyl-CoA dehydrogenase
VNLDPTETQTLLCDTVREYLERELPFDRIRALDREQRWDEALWREICAQGWLALPFAEAHGGSGSLVEAGMLVEAFARRAAVIPIAEVVAAGRAIEAFASAELAADCIRGLLEGGRRIVPAVSLEATDLRVGPDETLTGEAPFVDYGQFASDHLVAAHEEGGPALFLVDASRDEVAAAPLHSIGRTPLARVRYSRAPAQRVGGADAVASLVRSGRALAAVQCLACMQQALDMTVAYAGLREQFGRPIGSFQAVRHHCADMASSVESARLLVYEVLDTIDRGVATDAAVAIAKASVSRATPEVTMLAHQIHGGNGVIEENNLYFFTLRGKERSLAWGSVDQCLEVVAADVDGREEWL